MFEDEILFIFKILFTIWETFASPSRVSKTLRCSISRPFSPSLSTLTFCRFKHVAVYSQHKVEMLKVNSVFCSAGLLHLLFLCPTLKFQPPCSLQTAEDVIIIRLLPGVHSSGPQHPAWTAERSST